MKRVHVQPKRRFPRAVLPISAGLVAIALLWWTLAVPALVKYPTDLDVTPRYEGVFTLFVDPETATPLATPVEMPLDIERHIRSLGDESGASRVVVEETITQRAGDFVDATQTNVYVMDRRTLQNVADDRAYAFEPSNVVDRSGAYRLNLPFDTSSASTYDIYKNEIWHDLRDARRHDHADHRRGRSARATTSPDRLPRCPSTMPTWRSFAGSCRCRPR